MSTYTDTVRRLCAALASTARSMSLSDDPKDHRRVIGELALWLRILGFKADRRVDHIRVFGVELFFADCLWQFDGAVGARNVAVALATMSEEVEDRADDDDLTPYMWTDGTQLTKRELRAWLRA